MRFQAYSEACPRKTGECLPEPGPSRVVQSTPNWMGCPSPCGSAVGPSKERPVQREVGGLLRQAPRRRLWGDSLYHSVRKCQPYMLKCYTDPLPFVQFYSVIRCPKEEAPMSVPWSNDVDPTALEAWWGYKIRGFRAGIRFGCAEYLILDQPKAVVRLFSCSFGPTQRASMERPQKSVCCLGSLPRRIETSE